MKTGYELGLKKNESKAIVLLYILLSLIGIAITSLVCYYVINVLFKYNIYITKDNRGDYFTIMGTHCSVVFLTTSLMAMLSEKNKYIYWVEMVTKKLILPRFTSFFALATYSLSTIIGSFIGLLYGMGPIVIGSFIFGIIAVTLLFSRIVSLYYQSSSSKNRIEKFLYKKIKESDYEKYLIRLKEITYIKADGREFDDVYDNLNLVESCIIQMYEGCPREEQHIFYPKGFCENIYMDMISELAFRFPQEMQDYIDNHAKKNEIIIKLDYLIYPMLLESYIESHRIDLFNVTLCNWSRIMDQWSRIEDYIIGIVDDNADLISEYYSKLFNRFNREIKLYDNVSLYMQILQILYFEKQNIYRYILQYKDNRRAIYRSFFDIDNIEQYPANVLAGIAEDYETKTESYAFVEFLKCILDDEIVRHQRGSEAEREYIEKNPVMLKIIRAFVDYRKEIDLEFALGKILEMILDLDSGVYLNAGGKELDFYSDFEKWTFDYAVMSVKKEMVFEDTRKCTTKHNKKIDILQNYLELLNYKNRRK